MKKLICALLFTSAFFTLNATTWDEPWQDAIIKKSESFIVCKVQSMDSSGVKATLIKKLAGKDVANDINVNDFYMLNLTSMSGGHGIEFEFPSKADTLYLFVVQGADGNYKISTPTSGFAYVFDGQVYATFRHSYHQALVTCADYEMAMTAIFNNYKGMDYDKTSVKKIIDEALLQTPSSKPDAIFFKQHIALELIYHLNLSGYDKQVMPFVDDLINFHHQVSGIRALSRTNSKEVKDKLILILKGKHENFSKVIAVWALRDLKAVEYKSELKKISKQKYAKEETGFGGNIMDPRVGTHFPSSLHWAIESVINDWEKG